MERGLRDPSRKAGKLASALLRFKYSNSCIQLKYDTIGRTRESGPYPDTGIWDLSGCSLCEMLQVNASEGRHGRVDRGGKYQCVDTTEPG